MDPEFIKWLASLGVGGSLAGLLFFFYRKDVERYTEQWKGVADAMIQVVKENTTAISTLIVKLEREHEERSSRIGDNGRERIQQLEDEIARLRKIVKE